VRVSSLVLFSIDQVVYCRNGKGHTAVGFLNVSRGTAYFVGGFGYFSQDTFQDFLVSFSLKDIHWSLIYKSKQERTGLVALLAL